MKTMQKVFNALCRWFFNLKISPKIALCFILLSLVSFVISNMLFQQLYSGIALKQISESSMRTLYSVNENIELSINNLNKVANMIIVNRDVIQSKLKKATRDPITISDIRIVNRYLFENMQVFSLMDSLFIFDESENNYYYITRRITNERTASEMVLDPLEWYDDISNNRSRFLIITDFDKFSWLYPKRYLTFMKTIYGLDTITPMGVVVLNVRIEDLFSQIGSVFEKANDTVLILDENNEQLVLLGRHIDLEEKDMSYILISQENNRKMKIGQKQFLVRDLQNDTLNWRIIMFVPLDSQANETVSIMVLNVIVILLNSILIFGGAILVSRIVTKPVKILLNTTLEIQNGNLTLADGTIYDDEIGQLYKSFNAMVVKIQTLIENIIHEQKTKRKLELDVLQSQIKPHFLYNSFDAISSLSLSGKDADVYKLVKALGGFYRSSLSSGREVITVGEELNIIKNYLIVQKLRYSDLFDVEYQIDDEAKQYKILRFVLQPLVENAIYHGIRNNSEKGMITIIAQKMHDHVKLVVQDDGIGMSTEKVLSLTKIKGSPENVGYGLVKTIERLMLFYNSDDVLQISSSIGQGTTITLRLPLYTNE